MKKLFLVLFASCGLHTVNCTAQGTGFNTTGANPNASAMVDIEAGASANRGLLIPRVTFTQRTTNFTPLPAAAQGLTVYQTDAGGTGEGYYYNTSTNTTPAWVKVGSGTNNWVNAGTGSAIDANSTFPGVQVRNNTQSFYTANLTMTYNGTASTGGEILGSVCFGDNQGTAAQAGMFSNRDAASSSGTDLPTRLVFYTIPDASSTLTEAMRITSTQQVGIGTTNPGTHRLSVVGTAGLSTGTAWINTSDIRLKDVHGNYEYGLNEILKLRTIRFNYKKDNPLGLPSDKEVIGFVAQEVQAVIPDAVNVRPDGYLELNVDPIHWATVNAVKELNAKCVKQENEIAKLSADNGALKAEMEQIKLQIGLLGKSEAKK